MRLEIHKQVFLFWLVWELISMVLWLTLRGKVFLKARKKKSCYLWTVLKVKIAQSCLTLCDPMDYSLPGSSVHGILRVRILEWIDVPFSRGSSQPRDWIQVSRIAGWFFTSWATSEAQMCDRLISNHFFEPFQGKSLNLKLSFS